MPWKVIKRDSQYCVVKRDSGSLVACHTSLAKARRQVRALYTSESAYKAEPDYSARGGQVIRGNLARAVDGKFTSAGNAGKPAAPKPPVKPGAKPKPPAKAKPVRKPRKPRAVSPEVAKRRAEVAARRKKLEAERARREEEKKRSNLDKAVQRYQRDEQRRRERDQAAGKREIEKRQRETAQALRKRIAEQRRAEPKKGGGGGSKKPGNKPAGADLPSILSGAAKRLSAGEGLSQEEQATLVRNGLARRDREGNLILTAQGLRATKETVTKREGDGAHPSSHYLVVEDPQSPSTWHLRVRNAQGEIDPRLLGGAWAALHGGYRGNKYEGPDKQKALAKLKKLYAEIGREPPGMREKGDTMTFHVFKDSSGKYRWLAVSSTAFLDRDGEIVSTKALEDDVLSSDIAGLYGPLRWWHVPKIELGDCDYRAVDGRSLIESGTFRNEAIAMAIAEKAGTLQLSLGFIHPHTEPDPEGVFHTIQTFERSLVPVGRASNPWTRLVVKEVQMLTAEKLDALKALIGEDEAARFVSQVQSTEKALEAGGVTYKETPAPPAAAMEAMAVEVEEDAIGDEEESSGGDMLLTPEEIQSIAAAVAPMVANAVMETLGPLLNMETKIRGVMDELKAYTSAAVSKKDDEVATLRQETAGMQRRQVATEQKLQELLGEQPAANPGFRASQSPSTIIDPALHGIATKEREVLGDFFTFVRGEAQA